MEKYFIFLDIDGTLWDNSQSEIKKVVSQDLSADSVSAVNFLCENLQHNGFKPEIVIISKQRVHWLKCRWNLWEHGLNKEIPLIKLPIGKFTRGERISLMLYDAKRGKDIYETEHKFSLFDYFHLDYASKCNNYVVIDDRPKELANIPSSNYIQTNIDNGRLNTQMVVNYLQSKGLIIESPLTPKQNVTSSNLTPKQK